MPTIFELVNDWENEGYGIALMESSGDRDIADKVITPYIDPSDYPTMLIDKSCNGAKVTNMGQGEWYIMFHSGYDLINA